MTDQFRSDPDNHTASFVFNPVPSLKRDLLYNFTLALKLPVQTLGLIESLVASEIANFTLYDQNIRKELDPRQPNQYEKINLA